MRTVTYFLLALGGLVSGSALVTCGSAATGTDTGGGRSCPNGFCATSGSGGSSTATSGSTTASASASAGTGGSGCVESWSCTPWQTSGTGDAGTRVCTDGHACGTTTNKPIEAATLPALDLDYYKCKVEPILDRGCANLGCHGTEQGRALRIYARGRLRHAGEMLPETGCLKPGTTVLSDKCVGSIECACYTAPHTPTEWQRNYDAARSFAMDAQGQPIPAGMEDTSDLIAQPIENGKAHAGVHLFKSGDPEEVTLKSWLSGTTLGMTCTTDN